MVLKESITTKELPPEKQPGLIAVDVSDASGKRIFGETFKVKERGETYQDLVRSRRARQKKALENAKREQEAQEQSIKLQEQVGKERQENINYGTIAEQLKDKNQFQKGTQIREDFGKFDPGQIYVQPTLVKKDEGYVFIEPPKSGTGAFTYTPIKPKYIGGGSGLGATLTFDVGEEYEPIVTPASGTGEVISSSLKPTLKEKISIESQQAEAQIRKGGFEGIKGGTKSLFLGVGSTAYGVGSSLINPIETAKGIGSSIMNPTQTTKTVISSLREGFKQNPTFVFGEFAGYYGVGKGISLAQKGVLKATDIYRTRGLIELKATDVIAPEFYAGQTYPKIKTGQTAGSLLKEFKPAGQYGVTKLTGFTSAPKPLSGEVIGVGSSELPGLYQAPKISPKFLRVGGEEKKVFSFNILGDTLRPSVFKVNPQEFKLVQGVKPSQSSLFELSKAKKFYSSKAEKGKSYVPFIKTEKEAIIPAGTEFNLVDKRFFFKFENRRVPIYEFETKTSGKGNKVITSNKLTESISRSRIGRRARYSPADLLSSSSLVSKKVSKSKTSRVIYPKRTSSKSYSSPTYRDYYQSYLLPSSTRTPSYRYNILGSSYSGGSIGASKYPIIPTSFQKIKLKFKSKTNKQLLKQPTKYQPSFTASALDIRSKKIPGIAAISVRPIIAGDNRKKRKKRR